MNAGLTKSHRRAVAGTAMAAACVWALAIRDVTGQVPVPASVLQSLTAATRANSVFVQGGLAERCAGREVFSDPVLTDIATTLSIDDDGTAKHALIEAENELRSAALVSPDDVRAQYRLAIVLGARALREGGRTQVGVAKELSLQAQRVLDLEPAHAGGHYLLGYLHASVRRLGWFTRLLATTLLGGGALKRASWEEAQRHLEAAEETDPCEPDYHYELARLYHDRDQRESAECELSHVFELTEGHDGRWGAVRSHADRLASKWKKTP